MKRLFITLVVLFIFYFGIQILFKFQSSGFENEYVIENGENTFTVKEVYTANTKGEEDSYHIEITHNNLVYNFNIYKNLNKLERIVENVEIYDSCIYPVFRDNKQYFDITCLNNGVQTYYHDLSKTSEMNLFAERLTEEYNYDASKFVDFAPSSGLDNNVFVYKENLVTNHYVGIQNYRGLYTINNINASKVYDNKLFERDIYNASLSALVNNLYVVADYNESYNFNSFYVVNLKNNTVKEVENLNLSISFDSYIQGIVDESLYLFDPSTLKQYELDTKKMTVIEVGNESTKILYYADGEWSRVSAYDAVKNKLYFQVDTVETHSLNWVKEVKYGGSLTGTTYYIQKSGTAYRVYKSANNSNVRTYIFTTTNINNINYSNDYVYYINGDTLYYYSDMTGSKKLYQNRELVFNQNIEFYIYK